MSEPTVISMAVKMAGQNLAIERKLIVLAVVETLRDAAGDEPMNSWVLNKRLGDFIGSDDENAILKIAEQLFPEGQSVFFNEIIKELGIDPHEMKILFTPGLGFVFLPTPLP